MKVLFVSHSSVIPTYREKLRLLSRRKDIDLTLLLPRHWPEAGRRVETQNQPESRGEFRIISAPILFEGRLKRHFYPSFGEHTREVNPDLIHIEEEPYSLVAWQAARSARRLGIPLVFFTWENLLERFGFPHQMIRAEVLRTAARAIAGDIEAGQLLRKAGYPSNWISIIPQYGVDPELFHPQKVPALKKKLGLKGFTVGYAGRLVAEKGLYCLLEAFHLLKDHHSRLLLVGGGPLRGELENKAREMGLADRVRWVSSLIQTEVPDYLNAMDALVLPSLTTPRWKEQFGRVLIEAQACGVPVVGSDSGAIPEVIGKAGLIFPEGDAARLAGQLEQLARSPTYRKTLGRKGRQRILGRYTNQHIADGIYGVYKKVLG